MTATAPVDSDAPQHRVAVVTGASRGIGAAIAERLARDGFRVIGTATSETGAEAISKRLERLCPGSRGIEMRVDDDTSVAAALAAIGASEGAPLVLVNNAGVTRDNLLVRMKPAEWSEVLQTNLTALFRTCSPLVRGMMRARWGRIVNIGSVVAGMGNAGQTNYAAAKAGIEGFSRALAREVASRNITVNVVAPGFIATDMTASLNDAQRESMLTNIPMGRLGSVDDVAALVAFLCSDAAGYITGETIHVNGGMYMS